MSASRQALICAFLLGALLGVLGGSRYQRMASQKAPDAQRMLDRLGRKLDLDAGQRQAVKPVLERQAAKMKALREDAARRARELRLALSAELAPLLRPEQNKKFEDMTARWLRRHPN